MKTKLIIIATLAIILAACKTEEPELQPIAKFSFTINGNTVTFKNLSKNAKTYSWSFGDGTSSSENNPVKTYSTLGKFTVTLRATNVTKSNTFTGTINLAGNTPIVKTPTASFSYKTEHPLKVTLTNTSANAVEYLWSFGDDSYSFEKNPTHKYDNIGVYKIKLRAYNEKDEYSDYESVVTIEAPTRCYMTGFTISNIPTNNNYYQLQLTDDYLLSKTTYFYTDWYLLSSANLPFYHELRTQKELSLNSTYIARLYKRSTKPTGQATGKGDYTASITSSQLNKYPENILWKTTNIGIEFDLMWK